MIWILTVNLLLAHEPWTINHEVNYLPFVSLRFGWIERKETGKSVSWKNLGYNSIIKLMHPTEVQHGFARGLNTEPDSRSNFLVEQKTPRDTGVCWGKNDAVDVDCCVNQHTTSYDNDSGTRQQSRRKRARAIGCFVGGLVLPSILPSVLLSIVYPSILLSFYPSILLLSIIYLLSFYPSILLSFYPSIFLSSILLRIWIIVIS